jgi:hypothetical protein
VAKLREPFDHDNPASFAMITGGTLHFLGQKIIRFT